MRRLLMALLLLCIQPLTGFTEEPNSIDGDWALTLPSGEAGWLSVSDNDGKPHVELMWAVGGVRVMHQAKMSDKRLTFYRARQGWQEGFSIVFEEDQLSGTIMPILVRQGV